MTQVGEQGKQAIDALVALGHMRVWSVVITIFGDAVVPRGGVVASSTLAALTEQMGVKPEALRVALSRLTKDGWIKRSRQGRLSFYQLSSSGVKEFGPAIRRVYATEPGSDAGWSLALTASAPGDTLPLGAVSLGGRAFLCKTVSEPPQAFAVSGVFSQVPDWVKERVGVEDVAAGYIALKQVLGAIKPQNLSELEAAVLRVLIVHQWRRLVLRHADLPTRFFPDDWQGEVCRKKVIRLLDTLHAPSARWFDAQIS